VTNRQKLEALIREWLRNHYGVITWDEAIRLGASKDYIRSKLDSGAWIRVHRGVYRDAAVPRSPNQDLRAAFRATGGTGVVSHGSAAWLWDLVPTPPTPPELTVPLGLGKAIRPAGLTIHRYRDLDIAKAIHRRDVLVTNPMRTIVDLAATFPSDALTSAIDNAVATRLFNIPTLVAEVHRLARRGRPGLGALRYHLKERGLTGAPAPSVLESRALRLIMAAGLPLPEIEYQVGPEGEYRLDFAWPDILLTIEVDGYVWHFSPEHKARDEARRNHIQDLGWTLRVYTWRTVRDDPARMVREISENYARSAAKSSTIWKAMSS
jgi:hypothetical protein